MIPLGGPDLAQYAGKKHINRGRWNKEEDEKLKRLVEVHGERWDFVASHFPDRADVQCQHRWQKVVNPELVKGTRGIGNINHCTSYLPYYFLSVYIIFSLFLLFTSVAFWPIRDEHPR
jgi:hypothetical protein